MVRQELAVEELRFLELHEARVHAIPGRRVRDLGDAVLLHDPIDREPFWNRLAGIRWPTDPRAFDRRLDEAITLFATLDRAPHIWPRPMLNEPPDLVRRLEAAGFTNQGGNLLMLRGGSDAPPDDRPPAGVTVERLHALALADRADAASDLTLVLAEAFEVEPARRASIAAESVAMFDHPEVHACLVRVDGEPAAVAKRTTFDGASYLSSIGTRPRYRGRGLGSLVTAAITRDALEAASRTIYLGVFTLNVIARRMYERLGYRVVGGETPDLLMR